MVKFGAHAIAVFAWTAAFALHAGRAEAKTVTLGPSDNHTRIALMIGDTLVVTLPGAGSTGYRWKEHLAVGSPLSALNDDYAPHGGGTYTFRLNAARVGSTSLTFAFEKEIKTGPAPDVTSTFSVPVDVSSGIPASGQAVLLGVYKGTLPCADCNGVAVELRFYAKSQFDTADAFFIRSQTYLATRNGDRTYSDRGLWFVLRGDAQDADARVYRLDPGSSESPDYFVAQQEGAALAPLDRDMRPIKSPRDLRLYRVRQP